MSRSEAEIQNAIFLKYGREPDVTLYRNNTGQAKTPICERSHLERLLSLITLGDPRAACELIRALLKEPQRFTRYGLTNGSSDIIGIVSNRWTQDECLTCLNAQNVGNADQSHCDRRTMGVFLALEVKTETGRVSTEQQMFLDLVNRRGGVGRVVRGEDDAGRAIEEARRL